jgi:hypothetical protein
LFSPRDWLTTCIDDVMSSVDSESRWYDEARIKISLGSRSPIEHRMNMRLAA